MPQIDEHGSTSIEGGIDVRGSGIDFTENGIEVDFDHTTSYIIQEVKPSLHKLEGGFEIESGLYQKEVVVRREEPKREYFRNDEL